MKKMSLLNESCLKKIKVSIFYSRLRAFVVDFIPEKILTHIKGKKTNDVSCFDDDCTVNIFLKKMIIGKKIKVGIIKDFGFSTWWPKYEKFLKNNKIDYDFYDPQQSNWIEEATQFDFIIGFSSCASYYLEEMRRKIFILEKHLHKKCFPNYDQVVFYEDKIIEDYLSKVYKFPFIETHIFNNKEEATEFALCADNFPCVSKVNPGSSSHGVEMVDSSKKCLRIVNAAFSASGRKTHFRYYGQKNYVYFQKYIPNDGYDLRIIVISDMVFGYYRQALENDFRASGMGTVEKRELPIKAMKIARNVNKVLKFPMLVVDLLKDDLNNYHIIEMSPICRIDTPEQLHVNGKPGAYLFSDNDHYNFVEGRYWVQELVLKNLLDFWLEEKC